MTDPVWPRAGGRLKVEALALISVTTALRFYGFPVLSANRPIGSWCACCRCWPDREFEDYGSCIHARRAIEQGGDGTPSSWGCSRCQIPSAPRKFFSDVVSGIFRSLRMLDSPGYGYVNAGVRCDGRKKVLYLMATLVSRFTIFRRSPIRARRYIHIRFASTTGSIAILSRIAEVVIFISPVMLLRYSR